MTPQEFVGIAVRLFCIWIVFLTLQFAGLVSESFPQNVFTKVYITAFLVLMTVVYLWLFPLVIAHKIIPRTKHDNFIKASPLETAAAGCLCIGLLAIISGLPELVGEFAITVKFVGNGESLRDLSPEAIKNGFVSAIKFLLGVYLVRNCRLMASHVIKE